MTYQPVEGFPALYGVPQPRVELRDRMAIVEVDDVVDGRARSIRIVFEPFQAVRITTEDCFIYEDEEGEEDESLEGLVEVVGSPWVEELTAALAQLNKTATFMNKARHFLITTRENVVEVVAWEARWDVWLHVDKRGVRRLNWAGP